MADLHNMFPNGRETPEAKAARLEAHLYHTWLQLNALKAEVTEIKKDRAALLLRIGRWAVYVLVAVLSAILSKGSTLGYVSQKLLEAMSGAS